MNWLFASFRYLPLSGAVSLTILLASGCASPGLEQSLTAPMTAPTKNCRHWLNKVNATTRAMAVTDGEASRVGGFPYLRVNRHLQAVGNQIATPRQATDWLNRLQALDQSARETEIRNLPATAIPDLLSNAPASKSQTRGKPALLASIQKCSRLLLATDAGQPEQITRIRSAAIVPDHYSTFRRAAGLYALSSFGVAAGVRQWESETLKMYREYSRSPTLNNATTRVSNGKYRAGQATASRLIASRRQDSLGIPILTPEVKNWLLREFAPVFVVDRRGAYDDTGAIKASVDGVLTIDSSAPTIYARVAFTRYRSESLIQLVYTIWFPERPPQAAVDIYAGELDGLTVRLTLNNAGRPAVIDTIHPCGCYHQFFHTSFAKPLARPSQRPRREEWRFMPADELTSGPNDSLHVYVQSATHYVRKMRFEPSSGLATPVAKLADDRTLTRLTKGSGTETISLFDSTGLVRGTERSQRWLLWPMGIESPGAMRQWGTHATAFVGRRHFDDADLMQSRFDLQ